MKHSDILAPVQCMLALGHHIQDDGSTERCFDATIRALWRSFFANAGCRDAKKMPRQLKAKLLASATRPILSFRVSRWPFQVSKAQQLDRIQRRMLAIMLNLQPLPGQDAIAFKRWRAREAGRLQREVGPWSRLWASNVQSWSEHSARPRKSCTWAAQTMKLRTPT